MAATNLPGRLPTWSFDPTTPFALYTAAAVLLPMIAPYTLLIMLPTNNRLMEKAEKTDAVSPSETQDLLRKWTRMNYNRAFMVAVGAVLGMTGVLVS